MAARVSKDGVTITGSDMVYNYQQVLRQIVYTNHKPAYYLNRVFKLTCSELNGRFTSNEYVQTVSIQLDLFVPPFDYDDAESNHSRFESCLFADSNILLEDLL